MNELKERFEAYCKRMDARQTNAGNTVAKLNADVERIIGDLRISHTSAKEKKLAELISKYPQYEKELSVARDQRGVTEEESKEWLALAQEEAQRLENECASLMYAKLKDVVGVAEQFSTEFEALRALQYGFMIAVEKRKPADLVNIPPYLKAFLKYTLDDFNALDMRLNNGEAQSVGFVPDELSVARDEISHLMELAGSEGGLLEVPTLTQEEG